MSYDLHITKADHWAESDSVPITSDDMLKIADLMETYKGIPFLFLRGRITVGGADERVIGLMIEMAERIGARVQGDEGELYDNKTRAYPPPPDYLREPFEPQRHSPSAFVGNDGSIHIDIPRFNKRVVTERNEDLSKLHGRSDNWKVELAHLVSGKVTWKLTYIGTETFIKSLVYVISSKHSRSKGLISSSRDKTKGLVYGWATYLGKSRSLRDETILLKLKWNDREEEISFLN